MRNTRAKNHENVQREVFSVKNDYQAEQVLTLHQHQRCQCLYATTGLLTVTSQEKSWILPPRCALWIPYGIEHEVRVKKPTSTYNAYVSPESAHSAGLPMHCTAIGVSPLLHELLTAAVDLPKEYAQGGHDDHLMQLLIEEIAEMPQLPLGVPLPKNHRLAELCHQLLQAPTLENSIDTAAQKVSMSRRSFTRLFREETGMSFCAWRKQASLLNAITLLDLGLSVTDIAMELGYSTGSAFTVAFRRALGHAPSRYSADRTTK